MFVTLIFLILLKTKDERWHQKARRRASKNEIAKRVAAVDVADCGASYNPSALEQSK